MGIRDGSYSKVGVLGAGMMGAGIAFVTARAGCEVVLIDRSQDEAERGKAYAKSRLARDLENRRIDQAKVDDCLLYTFPSPRDSFASRMPSLA